MHACMHTYTKRDTGRERFLSSWTLADPQNAYAENTNQGTA